MVLLARPEAVNASEYELLMQYGQPRTASTFDFMVVCVLAHLSHGLGSPGGYRKKVSCGFEPKGISGPRFAALAAEHPGEVRVGKAHQVFDLGAPPDGAPVPEALYFVSSREEDVAAELAALLFPERGALGGVQAYDEFVELGLASIRRNFRAVFPDVSDEQFLMVREYMAHWDVLRQCCGGQAARSVVAQLHGLRTRKRSWQLDRPHCELYDLDVVEEALFNTTIWRWNFAAAGQGFWRDKEAQMRRGMCCFGNAEMHNGGYFNPKEGVQEYLRAHGDPRDHKIDVKAACSHRNYQSDYVEPIHVDCPARPGFPPCRGPRVAQPLGWDDWPPSLPPVNHLDIHPPGPHRRR